MTRRQVKQESGLQIVIATIFSKSEQFFDFSKLVSQGRLNRIEIRRATGASVVKAFAICDSIQLRPDRGARIDQLLA